MSDKQEPSFPLRSQWMGKRVAFLGDSITDKCHVGTTKNYWGFLQDYLGVEPLVYGVNGAQWDHIPKQAKLLAEEHGDDVDCVIVFAGTNDYNSSIPLGSWFRETADMVEVSGPITVKRRQRIPEMDGATLRGRINIALDYIRRTFVRQQVILLTPIHRGFATFGPGNIQPVETWANALGLFIDDYIRVVREAGDHWAVPVIDLDRISGLLPRYEEHFGFFHDVKTDRLHPNAEGHRRMALALTYQLLSYPSDLK